MLFRVPGAKSSDGLPATVTRPDFSGCLNCRWLPRVATRYQPSASKSLMTSRTFTLDYPWEACPLGQYGIRTSAGSNQTIWALVELRGFVSRLTRGPMDVRGA